MYFKKIVLVCSILTSWAAFSQIKIGNNPNSINSNSLFELESTNKGLLIPRLALTATNSASPLSAHVNGMVIYNTATAGTAPNNVVPGMYYNDGSQWVKVVDNVGASKWTNVPASSRVQLTNLSDGTTARSSSAQFVITDLGRVAIGATVPIAKLDVISNPTFDYSYGIRVNGTGGFSGNTHKTFAVTTNDTDRAVFYGDGKVLLGHNGGNIGIGTGTPREKLDVEGNVRFSGALMPDSLPGSTGQVLTSAGAGNPPTWTDVSSLSANNIYNTNGTLTGNRTVTQGANTLAFTSTAINGFSVDGTTFSVDAANNRIGIGTAAPNYQFSLGSSLANNKIALWDGGVGASFGLGVQAGQFRFNINNSGDKYSFFSSEAGTEILTLLGSGNLGVGVTSPSEKLQVAGNVRFSGALMPNNLAGTTGQVLTSAGAGTAPTWTDVSSLSANNIYNTNGTLTGNRTVTQGANTLAFTSTATNGFSVDGTTFSVDAANNRIGIGTAAPTSALDVRGYGIFSNGTSGVGIGQGGWGDIYAFGTNRLTFNYNRDIPTDINFLSDSSVTVVAGGTGNFGVGKLYPSEKMDVLGNLRLSGAFMPNNLAGTSGQVLTSAGAGTAPTWTDVSSLLANNIYNTDGTLTGNRTVNLNNNNLSFNTGAGTLIINRGHTSSNTRLLSLDTLEFQSGSNGFQLVLNPAGNVGINKSAPTEKLDVTGNIRLSGALMPNNLAGTAGQVLTSAGAGTAPTWTDVSSLSANNIYNTNGTLTGNRTVTQGANTLAFTSTAINGFSVDGTTFSVDAANNRIGIGTTTPARKLSVNGDAEVVSELKIAKSTTFEGGQLFLESATSTNPWIIDQYQTTLSDARLRIFNGNSELNGMAILENGNIGISKTSPTEKLDVTGNIRLSGALMPNNLAGTAGQVLTSAGAGTAPTWTDVSSLSANNIYNTNGTLTGNRTVTQGSSTLAFTSTATNGFSVDGTTFSVDAANNRIGIGTATPNYQLSLGSSVANNKLALWDGGVGASFGLGVQAGQFRFNINNSGDKYSFFSSEAGTEILTLLGSGNLGVGVTSPSEKLQVAGNMRFSGALMPNNLAGTAGQVLTSSGAGTAPTWTSVLTAEVDGIIGNEVTNATASGGLERAGSGTTVSPYTLGVATSGITNTMIANDAVTTGKIANGTILGADINQMSATFGQILFWNGSTWAPGSLAFPSSNIYNIDGTLEGNRTVTQGANTLAFTSTATNGFSVDGTTFSVDGANNRIGLSTASPNYRLSLGSDVANTKLAIWDGGSGTSFGLGVQANQFRFNVNQNADRFSFLNSEAGTEVMTIRGSGNVGIGTTTPARALDVFGASMAVTNSGDRGVTIAHSYTNSAATASTLQLAKSRGTFAAPLDIQSGDDMGRIEFRAIAYRAQGGALIIGRASENQTSTANGTHLLFQTTPNGSTVETTRMFISQSGNVGIGTSAPTSLLDVRGYGLFSNGSSGIGVGQAGYSDIYAFGTGNRLTLNYDRDVATDINFNSDANVTIVTGGTGQLGIGTLSPDAKLTVSGTASKTGGGAWATFSDQRVKTDIKPFDDGLNVLMKLNPVSFKYNEKSGYSELDKTFIGFIAQEVEKVTPYMVTTIDDSKGPSGLSDKRQFDESALTKIMVNAIQEQQTIINNQEQKINTQQQQIDELTKKLDQLIKIIEEKK